MKRILCGVLALVLSLALAGCGGDVDYTPAERRRGTTTMNEEQTITNKTDVLTTAQTEEQTTEIVLGPGNPWFDYCNEKIDGVKVTKIISSNQALINIEVTTALDEEHKYISDCAEIIKLAYTQTGNGITGIAFTNDAGNILITIKNAGSRSAILTSFFTKHGESDELSQRLEDAYFANPIFCDIDFYAKYT